MADANTGLNVSPGPKSIAVEGMGASTEHSLVDQIELDRYNRANAAAKTQGGFFGVRRAKLIPHGSVFNGCKQ